MSTCAEIHRKSVSPCEHEVMPMLGADSHDDVVVNFEADAGV